MTDQMATRCSTISPKKVRAYPSRSFRSPLSRASLNWIRWTLS